MKTNTVHEKAKDSNGQILHDGETECDIENLPLVFHMKTHCDNMFQRESRQMLLWVEPALIVSIFEFVFVFSGLLSL